MDRNNLASDATTKSSIYRALSIALRCPEPGAAPLAKDGSFILDIINLLRLIGWEDSDSQELASIVSEFVRSCAEDEQLLSSMRIDYTRLFTVPQSAVVPIYEQLFRMTPDNVPDFGPVIITSPAALSAREHYQNAGLHLSRNDSADHMATEMEYMGYLYAGKAASVKNDDNDDEAAWQAHIDAFVEDHLGKWMLDFFKRLATEAKHPLYAAIGIIASRSWEQGLLP